MSTQRLSLLLAIVCAPFVAACAAGLPTRGAVHAGTGLNVNVAPSPAGIAKPPAVTISPSLQLEACTNLTITGGIDHRELLESVRKEDGEEFGKVPSDADRNKAWTAHFATIAAAKELKACSDEASTLERLLKTRHAAARTLCDLRRGTGAGDTFKDDTRGRLDNTKTALSEASKKKTLGECQQAAEAVKSDFLALIDTANVECSPRGGDADVMCSAQLAAFCKGDASAASAASTCLRDNAATNRELRGPEAAGPEGARSLGGAGLESAILTGAADFFVERAEQEMSLFAVEVVGRELCAATSPVSAFLPRTCELIGPVPDGETASTVGVTPGALRAAAKADLEALPPSLVEKIATHDHNLACAAAVGWAVADEVGHGADLVTLLKDPQTLVDRPLVKSTCGDGAKEDLKRLAEHFKRVLSGAPELVANQLRSGNFERLVATTQELRDPKAADAGADVALNASGRIVADVVRRLVELDRSIKAYHAAPKPELRAVMVIAALQTVEPILAHLAREAPNKDDVHTAIDLFADLLNRQYADAVVAAASMKVVREVLPHNARTALTLAAGVAQADSSDDVKKTLEDAALPLGSWRRKNVRRWGITLTGMVGGTVGHEFVTEEPNDHQYVTGGTSLAPTLLLGPDVHHGCGNTRWGIQLTILDLGALASIRLDSPDVKDQKTDATVGPQTHTDAEKTPDVRVEQVFAPGAFAYFGFGPFAVGPMVSFVPSLRPYKDANGEVTPLSVWRVGGVLAVDVSLLPLL